MHMYTCCIPSFPFSFVDAVTVVWNLSYFDFSFNPPFGDALCSCWNWTYTCAVVLAIANYGSSRLFFFCFHIPVDISLLWFCSVYITPFFSFHVQHIMETCSLISHFTSEDTSSFYFPGLIIHIDINIVIIIITFPYLSSSYPLGHL